MRAFEALSWVRSDPTKMITDDPDEIKALFSTLDRYIESVSGRTELDQIARSRGMDRPTDRKAENALIVQTYFDGDAESPGAKLRQDVLDLLHSAGEMWFARLRDPETGRLREASEVAS